MGLNSARQTINAWKGSGLALFLPAWLVGAALLAATVLGDSRIDTRHATLADHPIWSPPATGSPESWSGLVAEHQTGFPHSPALIEHDNGELQAVWFHGIREAHPSVGLWTSRRAADGTWTEQALLLDRHADMAALGYRIHTIGNPVLYPHPDGDAWLFYVNPSLGGWSTSRIALRRSSDRGLTWSDPVQLPTGPIFSISSLVRAAPLLMDDGLVALPAYHELIGKHSEFLLLDSTGRLVGRRFIADGIQANFATMPEQRWLALLRPIVGMPARLLASQSEDGGVTWSEMAVTDIPNPYQPVCTVLLHDGSTLIGYTPQEHGRDRLAFIHVDGETGQWRRLPQEITPDVQGGQTAYCTAIQKRNGDIALVYADPPGRRIMEFGFTMSWLAEQIAAGEEIVP